MDRRTFLLSCPALAVLRPRRMLDGYLNPTIARAKGWMPVQVYLDGRRVRLSQESSDTSGWVRIIMQDADGHILVDRRTHQPVMRVVHGHVRHAHNECQPSTVTPGVRYVLDCGECGQPGGRLVMEPKGRTWREIVSAIQRIDA